MRAKEVLRAEALARRRGMSAADREAAGAALASALTAMIGPRMRVAAYASVGTEPPTTGLLALGHEVLLPVLAPNGDLDWAAGPLAPARRGLLEPTGPRLGLAAIATCDVVLVPALAVDRSGNRLGRGGGSYDRALRRATGLVVAVLYDGELLDTAVPVEPHDVPVAAVITPSYGVTRLPGRASVETAASAAERNEVQDQADDKQDQADGDEN